MDIRILYFFNSSERDFSRKCSFHSRFDLSGLAQSTPQHDSQVSQITVIKLCSSGTFACTIILRKPLAFTGKL